MRFYKRLLGIVIGSMLLVCLVRFERLPGGSSVAQTNESDAISILVQRLFEVYQQKDLNRLISHWSEKSPWLNQKDKKRCSGGTIEEFVE